VGENFPTLHATGAHKSKKPHADPAGHGVHTVAPLTGANVPLPQAVGIDTLVALHAKPDPNEEEENTPASKSRSRMREWFDEVVAMHGICTHDENSDAKSDIDDLGVVPAGQIKQEVAPVEGWNVPIAHAMQLAPLLYEPAGHWHAACADNMHKR
jgi:hypothetical protein